MRRFLIELVVGSRSVIANFGAMRSRCIPTIPTEKPVMLINTCIVGGIPETYRQYFDRVFEGRYSIKDGEFCLPVEELDRITEW